MKKILIISGIFLMMFLPQLYVQLSPVTHIYDKQEREELWNKESWWRERPAERTLLETIVWMNWCSGWMPDQWRESFLENREDNPHPWKYDSIWEKELEYGLWVWGGEETSVEDREIVALKLNDAIRLLEESCAGKRLLALMRTSGIDFIYSNSQLPFGNWMRAGNRRIQLYPDILRDFATAEENVFALTHEMAHLLPGNFCKQSEYVAWIYSLPLIQKFVQEGILPEIYEIKTREVSEYYHIAEKYKFPECFLKAAL